MDKRMDLSPQAVKQRRERARYNMAYSGEQVLVEKEEYEALLELAEAAKDWKNLATRPGINALPEAEVLCKAIENYEFTMYFMPDQRVMDRARQIPDDIGFVDAESGEDLEDFGTITFDWEQKLHIAAMSIKWRQSLHVTAERIITKAIRDYLEPEDYMDGFSPAIGHENFATADA